MMLERFKNWGLALLAIAAAILYGLLGREKAGREKDKRQAEEGARKTEQKATDALTEGLKREDTELEAARARRRERRPQ